MSQSNRAELRMPQQGTDAGAAAAAEVTHTVKMSDTLASISVRYNISVAQLKARNNFKQGDQLWARQALIIPNVAVGADDSEPSEPAAESAPCSAERSDQKSPLSPPVKNVRVTSDKVQNEHCRNFLSRFDRKYMSARSGAEKALGAAGASASISGVQLGSVEPGSPFDRRGGNSHLIKSQLTTTAGRLQAESEALDAIQRILILDTVESSSRGSAANRGRGGALLEGFEMSAVKRRVTGAKENDLESDTQIYDL